jgi:hypothetical protein
VANYGLRPTVEQTTRPLLEVHLLEPSPLTYGDKLTVKWLHFLRPESKFGSVEELRSPDRKRPPGRAEILPKPRRSDDFQSTLDSLQSIRPLSRFTGW